MAFLIFMFFCGGRQLLCILQQIIIGYSKKQLAMNALMAEILNILSTHRPRDQEGEDEDEDPAPVVVSNKQEESVNDALYELQREVTSARKDFDRAVGKNSRP